jgi:hypothetical protein
MEEVSTLKVFVVKYFLFGNLTKTVVLAKNVKSAIDFIVDEDVLLTDVTGCEEVYGEGKVLTWNQP